MKPTHLRTPRTLDEACFTDCRYVWVNKTERRIQSGVELMCAVAFGLVGALFLLYGLIL